MTRNTLRTVNVALFLIVPVAGVPTGAWAQDAPQIARITNCEPILEQGSASLIGPIKQGKDGKMMTKTGVYACDFHYKRLLDKVYNNQ